MYNSIEHLRKFLRIDDIDVIIANLSLLAVLVKKKRTQINTDIIINSRLFHLSKSWGGKQDGLGLYPYCSDNFDVTPKVCYMPICF